MRAHAYGPCVLAGIVAATLVLPGYSSGQQTIADSAAGTSDTRLADAVERRDAGTADALLVEGTGVNATQPDGATALHWAVHWNDVAIVDRLIAAGADVNAVNDLGVAPLHLAAADGTADLVGVLLDAGADPNMARQTGETPVMSAARSGSVAAVKRLHAGGANPNAAQTSMGQTALLWAINGGHVDVARALLDAGATVTPAESGFTPLMFAARLGSIEASRMMLFAGDDINASSKDGSTPLLVATVRGHAKLAMFLLEQGAHPDGNLEGAGYTPLHWASSRSEVPFVALEIEPPGEWAAIERIPDRDDQFALIKSLVAHGADIEARTTRALMMSLVAFTQRVHKGATPFLGASLSADADVMRLLLALGADPLKRDEDDNQHTALMVAVGALAPDGANVDDGERLSEDDRVEAATVAIDVGVDIEAQDTWGFRAMHIAAGAGFHKVITLLLDRGAELNPRSKQRDRGDLSGGTWEQVPQTPTGVAESYFTSAIFQRPNTAEFLKALGGISEGATDLKTYQAQANVPSAP